METLRLVQIVFRHGLRSPGMTPEADIGSFNECYSDLDIGQLTQEGRRQMYEVGKYLRIRYNKFLTNNSRLVYARSSDFDRCLDSASCMLAGMYPPKETQNDWNPQLNWQPIPIHSDSLKHDNVLMSVKGCENIMNNIYTMKLPPKIEECRKRIEDTAGENIKLNNRCLFSVIDLLVSKKANGFTLPPKFIEVIPEAKQISHFILDSILKKTGHAGGPLLEVISNNISDYLNGVSLEAIEGQSCLGMRSPIKVHVFSTHDLFVLALLKLLELHENRYPDFGATILFEVHEIQDRNVVRIFYNNTTATDISNFEALQIPGCSLDCPVEDFFNRAKKYKCTSEFIRHKTDM